MPALFIFVLTKPARKIVSNSRVKRFITTFNYVYEVHTLGFDKLSPLLPALYSLSLH